MVTATAKKKILVVDDSPIMTLIIGNIVGEDPLLQVVEYASDGIEALAKVDSVKPDLILLDIEMPKMDGLEFMRRVRAKSNAKIVVVTAEEPNSPKVAQIKTMGIDGIIFKPSGSVSSDLKAKRSQEIRSAIHRALSI
jgi:two-component system chemotaxis response regulator CheB